MTLFVIAVLTTDTGDISVLQSGLVMLHLDRKSVV